MNNTYEMEETLKNTYGEETVANDLAPDETLAGGAGAQAYAPTNVAGGVSVPNNPTSTVNNAVPPMPAKAPILPGVANESLVGKGNSPQEVRNTNGELVGHVSNFGVYNRFTSTDGNKVFWTNSKGEQVEAPKSMQMMDAMNAGLSPNRGFRGGDWDQALKEVQAQGGIDAIRAQQYKRAAYDTLTLKERKKKQAEYNFTTADAVARAWTQVKNGYGEVKQDKDGNFYRSVRFSASDGYGPVVDANKQMADTGRKSRLRGLIVTIRTDKDGRPIDPATGKVIDDMGKVKPIIKMQVETAGGINGKSPLEVKDLDLGRVMNQHATSFAAMNDVSEDEARNNTYSLFGTNPLGWKVTETNKMTPELQKAYMEVALKEKELNEKARQFDAKLSSDEKIKFAELGNNKAIALVNAYEKMINSGGNAQDFLKALPEPFVDAYFGGKVVMENGEPKLNDDGSIMMMPLSAEENMNRFKALLNVTQKALTAMGYKSIPIMSMGNLVGGFPQATNNGAAETPAQKAKKQKALNEAKRKQAQTQNGANAGSADGTWGFRNDGTPKGRGWLGPLNLSNGSVATEYTVGVKLNGKETDIPTLVPGLTKEEIDVMVNYIIPNNKPVPESVLRKAVEHAKQQIGKGESVFAPNEVNAQEQSVPVGEKTSSTPTAQAPSVVTTEKPMSTGIDGKGGRSDEVLSMMNNNKNNQTNRKVSGLKQDEKSIVTSANTGNADVSRISRSVNGQQANTRKELLRNFKTVQDVAKAVVRSLNDRGELSSIVNPDGTRRKDLTPEEKDKIIFNIKQKFLDAGMQDFWEKQVEEYSPQNYEGHLSKDAILDKLLKDWNNKKAPFTYGYKRIQQR